MIAPALDPQATICEESIPPLVCLVHDKSGSVVKILDSHRDRPGHTEHHIFGREVPRSDDLLQTKTIVDRYHVVPLINHVMKERKVPLRIALPSDEAAAENEDQTGPGIVLLDRNGRIAIQEEAVRTLYGIEIRIFGNPGRLLRTSSNEQHRNQQEVNCFFHIF